MKQVLIFSALLLSSLSLHCATLTVCSSGCDYTTIAAAITAAASGDIIDIQAGTYTEAALTIDKDLTVQGQGQSSTIVQAAATRDAATDAVFLINEGYTVTIQNLTVQNGNTDPDNGSTDLSDGGGIWIDLNASSNINLTNLTITNNYSADDGGGIYTIGNEGTLTLTDCIITNNEANALRQFASGGGICNRGADFLNITQCSITNNHAGDEGGGFFHSEGSSTVAVVNCTIAENTIGVDAFESETSGAGVYLVGSASSVEFINCTIVENSMIGLGDGYGGGIFILSGSTANLVNTIVANNTTKGVGTSGRQIYIDRNIAGITQTTSLATGCNAPDDPSDCPNFSYTSAANIATTPSSCGLHTYYDVTGSDAASNGTPPGGDVPTDDLCGTARGEIHDIGAANVAFLPVELLYFTGRNTDGGSLLTWQTATEENNQGFSIEHSTDSKTWQAIGFVAGAESSTQIHDYTFLDDSPSAGINYYRLKQMDFDGSYEYSDMVALRFEASNADSKLVVFPNPASNFLNYRLADLNAVQSVRLLDMFGRPVKRISTIDGQISLLDVLPGSYILQIKAGAQIWQQMVVKQ
ncbi:MAG: right-handed parallel beta-helix repeat-containing protein [Bacteroidota bacterium]